MKDEVAFHSPTWGTLFSTVSKKLHEDISAALGSVDKFGLTDILNTDAKKEFGDLINSRKRFAVDIQHCMEKMWSIRSTVETQVLCNEDIERCALLCNQMLAPEPSTLIQNIFGNQGHYFSFM